MKKLKTMRLRTKIFLFNFLIFIIFIMLFSVLSSLQYINSVKNTLVQTSQQQNSLIINTLGSIVENTEDLLRVLSADKNMQNALIQYNQTEEKNELIKIRTSSELGKSISNVIFPATQLAGAVIWDLSGIPIYAGYSLSYPDIYKAVDQNIIDQVVNNQGPNWGELTQLEYTDGRKDFVFPVSKIVMDKETGTRLGILTLFMKESEISNIYSRFLLPENKKVYIADSLGNIVSVYNKKELAKNINDILEFDINVSALNSGKDTFIDKQNLYSIANYSDFKWNIITVSNLKLFYEEVERTILYNVIMLIIVLMAGFGSAFAVSHTIIKPLYDLLTVMHKVGSGNISLRAKQSDGEIGVLAKEFNIVLDKLQNSMDEIYTQQRSCRKNELRLLQTQIKPHFLYNAMEMISSLVRLNYKDKAISAIRSLSKFYRKSLSNGQEFISMSDEAEITRSYLEIQTLRYGWVIDYTIDFAPDTLQYKIPKLLLQPLVENAIYHGLKQLDKGGELIVRCFLDDEFIHLEVFDTGIGFDAENLNKIRNDLKQGFETTKRSSFGLYNVNERIKLYYGEKYGLTIESVYGQYTNIEIIVPKTLRAEAE